MDKVKVSAVSYLNSIPFVYGLEQSSLKDSFQLSLEIPSICAENLLDGTVDLGLVPVAIIPSMPYAEIISPYCIAADGAVETVCLFSEVPLAEIETILLDFHSRTSVQLVQLLAKNFWEIAPSFEPSKEAFEKQIKGKTAGVVIGDRAFQYRTQYPYVYDLSEEWKKCTGLPFVFACWVANKPLDQSFKAAFIEALGFGLTHLDQALDTKESSYTTPIDKRHYLTNTIQYQLTDRCQEGLDRFLALLKE